MAWLMVRFGLGVRVSVRVVLVLGYHKISRVS